MVERSEPLRVQCRRDRWRAGLGLIVFALGLSACDPAPRWTALLDDDGRGMLMAVWGTSDDDVWVVGGQLDEGVAFRASGDDLSEVPLPSGTPMLNWVHGTSATDVWLAGVEGTLLHWDGTAFTDHSVPGQDEAFWGVHARSATDAIAVGGPFALTGSEPVVYRWQGERWAELEVFGDLQGVSGWFKASHDGEQYHVVGAAGGALVVGEGAEVVPTGTGADLVTVFAEADRVPIAVGGRNTGAVMRWSGDRWTEEVRTINGLNGVHELDDGRAVIVGERGYGGVLDAGSGEVEVIEPLTTELLHACWVSPSGEIWAVGGNFFRTGDFSGVLLRARL